MKKLNRKGFTLVELLAVIIILAIVVGISIPSITNIINDSKNNALGVAVDAAEDYLADQYAYMNIDFNTATINFTNTFSGKEGTVIQLTGELLKEAGFSSDNVTEVFAKIDLNGKVCVEVETIGTSSEYYSTTYWTTAGKAKEDASNLSKSCGGIEIKTS